MKLKHFALYAKNWYKRTDNIWEDLKAVLRYDDYTPETKWDVYQIIQLNIHNYLMVGNVDYKFRTFIEGLDPKECWKSGYYTKDHNWGYREENKRENEYDFYEAFIRSAMSLVACAEVAELGGLPEPIAELRKPKEQDQS